MKSQRARRKAEKTRTNYPRPIGTLFGVLALSLIAYAKEAPHETASVPESAQTSGNGTVTFTDARRQAAEFISYDDSIALHPDQKKVMDEALSSVPAPCCAQYPIAKCCCPCNLAKSSWGLSKFLIARQHASAPQVKAAVSEWLTFTNPGTYTGDACFARGCERPFERNGCGGMDAQRIR